MYYVYVLYNKIYDKIYIGQTENLKERILAHNDKRFKQSYTSRFSGLWEILYQEKVSDRKDALRREKQLKSYRGREFLKNLIIPR